MEWSMGPPDTWERMGAWLRRLGPSGVTRPRAIVVVSAHWETPVVAVTSSSAPPLIFDYYGFPPHTYELSYPAPGDPALAAALCSRLVEAGIDAVEDPARGFDHGVFIPFKLIYPDADIPIVQLSLHASLDPAMHLAIGRALAPLRDEGVLIVGSGMSYHNMSGFMRGDGEIAASDRFDRWLQDVCVQSGDARAKALAEWVSAPAARDVHPREEHLLPLMVAAGAAPDDPGRCEFTDRVMGATVSAFAFG
jgi:aromatic ring-opening dioxygenase catalytic subunit (LigB family)